MNKRDFMNELYALLSPLADAERKDIMRDFEEHFAVGAEKGKSEAQICRELGNPKQCAAQFLTPLQSVSIANANRVNNLIYKIFAICLIISFIAVFPVSLGLIVASFWTIIASCISGVIFSSWLIFGFLASLSIFFLSLGVLMDLIMVWLIKICWRKGGV